MKKQESKQNNSANFVSNQINIDVQSLEHLNDLLRGIQSDLTELIANNSNDLKEYESFKHNMQVVFEEFLLYKENWKHTQKRLDGLNEVVVTINKKLYFKGLMLENKWAYFFAGIAVSSIILPIAVLLIIITYG